ncbi:MAG TPA: hypothetical protein VMF87_25715 [Streptosporangiaceae bacterium]|nr:hypothetical protein [Streptosporangiaceae bacterium]HUC26659.1 hypothetical protein [Streptosporangiaceae bacterium]
MLREDLEAPKKQRHTARRVLARLVDEHGVTAISYSTVRDYVADSSGQAERPSPPEPPADPVMTGQNRRAKLPTRPRSRVKGSPAAAR